MARARKTLTPEEFASRFKSVSRKLWCLAAAILGGRMQVEDVLQEAAVTALGRLESFEKGSNFAAWMGQIVRYTALNHGRRQYRTREFGVDGLEDAAQQPVPNGLHVAEVCCLEDDQEHFDDAVMRALRQLGEMARTCFLLRTVMGMPYQEISELLGVPEGTAMSHVHRSRATLRQLLEADVTFELCPTWRAS